ncbi:hypothetical protein [Stutzerimonas kunmingensis]|uniref:hypothetical protein n=1 Tax=Stutzerimonas kunmingensis TaxID=1211807 RepID=UPI00241BF542|nr:hypothetical protein [Stutzerimonas kunmingensis]
MLHKLRRLSPFGIFWALFYGAAMVALIVPWEIGEWIAYAAFAPWALGALIMALACGFVAVLGIGHGAAKVGRFFKRACASKA